MTSGFIKTSLIIFFFGLSVTCFSQSMPMEVDPHTYIQPKRAATKEQAIEEVEAYFLESMFLSGMVGIDQSLLTDEEKESSFISTDADIEKNMMMKALSKSLAQKDILGLKRQLLKSSPPAFSESGRTFR